MRQTTLSVVLEVQPESVDRLSGLIEHLRLEEETPSLEHLERFGRLETRLPLLHFMSLSVFSDAHYDPLFVIEANFDGRPGPFWAQLEAAIGPQLRTMVRCCKRPSNRDGPLFDAVAAPESRYPLAPYLEAKTIRPSAFQQGNRGLDRNRILQEGELFLATREALAPPQPCPAEHYHQMTAQEIHKSLRQTLLPTFPWLNQRVPMRFPLSERMGDALRLLCFQFLVFFCVSLPGLLFAPILPIPWVYAALALTFLLVGVSLYQISRPLTGLRPWVLSLSGTAAMALYIPVASVIGTALSIPITGTNFAHAWEPIVVRVALGLISAIMLVVPAIALCVRWLEWNDSSQDAPAFDEALLREMAHREDRIVQNHMVSMVLVKPGVLRMALFRTAHLGMRLFLRVFATNGYLISMRTIHFAHWAFVNNYGRLMFLSNFDHSWESYLDDFIEQAHMGLTLAWGSCVGFPPTLFLLWGGATHGRKFKEWARHSRTVSRFWFSAYKQFTVDQIERNYRIADGLRRSALTPEKATKWARDL